MTFMTFLFLYQNFEYLRKIRVFSSNFIFKTIWNVINVINDIFKFRPKWQKLHFTKMKKKRLSLTIVIFTYHSIISALWQALLVHLGCLTVPDSRSITDDDVIGNDSLTESAESQVEQRITQPNGVVQPFRRQMGHFLTDMSNRVEHKKLNQVTAELPPGWVFGVQLGLRQTQALINTYHIILIQHHSSSNDSLETDPTWVKLDQFPVNP